MKLISIALTLSTLLITASAGADTLVIDHIGDSCGLIPPGSLRAAIQKANASSEPDLLRISPHLSGATIRLCDCLPPLLHSVRIDAGGLATPLTIDASALSGCTVLDFDAGPAGARYQVKGNLALIGGVGPLRAVRVAPAASLELSIVSIEGFSSWDGAILSEGTLEIQGTELRKNSGLTGGAVAVIGKSAHARIDEAWLHDNDADEGGALYVADGRLEVSRSLLWNNRAKAGGALALASGAVTLEASTLSGHVASEGGTIHAATGTLGLYGVTIAETTAHSGGSAVHVIEAEVYLHGSIVAGPIAQLCVVQGATGRLYADFTLDTDRTCTRGGIRNISVRDPGLEPLAPNGGATWTHALQKASPAIDRGDPNACTPFDQRGFERPARAACDIGAYEAGAKP